MTITKQWPSGSDNPTPQNFNIPEAGEKNWSSLSNFLSALAGGTQATTFQKIAVRQAVTTPITIATNDCLVASKLTTPGAVTVNLPAGVAKQIFYIYDETGDASTNNITINRSGTDTIEGATSLTVATDNELVALAFDSSSSDWKVFMRCRPNIAVGSISGLGSGVAAWLADPTSAKLATAVTDETGSGLLVFNNGPTFVAPALGTPASGVLTNCTGLPISSLTGSTTGTGALVFATSPTLVTPALGTPSSGTLSNCGGLPLTTGVTGVLPIANGGTNGATATAGFDNLSPLTTKGDLIGHDGSNNVRQAIGADGLILKADSTTSTGLAWGSAAAGTGEINYIENPDAEANTTGWATYADAAGTTPVDGTGGSPTVTWTRQDSVVLRGNQSFKLTKDAANRQGEGVSYDFTIKEQDISKKLKIQFDFKTNEDAAYASGDLTVYIYDVTNSTLITPVDTDIIDGQNIFQTNFNSTTSTSYRLVFHIATTNASAWDAYIDNVIVGPGMTSQGAAIGGWQSYTPTITNASTSSVSGFYRRVGDEAEIRVAGTMSGAASGGLSFSLPSGITVNTSLLDSTNDLAILGTATAQNSGTNYENGVVVYNTGSGLINCVSTGDSSAWNASFPFTWANTDEFSLTFKIPVTEWAGKGIVPMLAEDNLSEWQSFTPTVAGWTGTTASNMQYRRVGDTMEIRGDYTPSGSSAVTAEMDIPLGLTIALDSADDTYLGELVRDHAPSTRIPYAVLGKNGDTSLKFSRANPGSSENILTPADANLISSTERISFTVSVPILEWTGSQNSLVGYTEASSDNLGLVKRNKWQRKDLTTDKTTTQSPLTELSFNGLTVGKTYRIAAYGVVSAGGTNARSEYYIQHDSTDITRARVDRDSSTTGRGIIQTEVIFTATTTSVEVRWVVVSGTITLEGTLANTCYSILEELNNYEAETTDFT